ncbi:hypothetical protein ABPG74_012883 [Tetrahymena malaccensis]
MKKYLFLFIFASLTLCAQTSNLRKFILQAIPWEFQNCGSENDPMVVTAITLDAVPEKSVSDDITIVGVSNVHDRIVQARIDVFLQNVKITSLSQPFLQEADPGDQWIFKYGSFIPNIAPTGRYTIKFTFVNSSQKQLACASLEMDL